MIQTSDTTSVPESSHDIDEYPLETYQMTAQRVADELKVDLTRGLNAEDASERLNKIGPNEISEGRTTSIWELIYAQIAEPLVIILLIAAGLSAVLGKIPEFFAISAIVVLNAMLGVFQEYRAEKAIAALKRMSQPFVRVRRDGKQTEISARDVVPGDLILLEAGNIIPADARLVEANNLRVQEASLTGESYAVDKLTTTIEAENLPIGDRKNMLYMGTNVVYGRGEALVTQTGMKTELGKVADLLQSVESDKSPLQKRMQELGRILFYAAFVVMGLAFVIGIATGQTLQTVLLNSVAIAVAVVPEGLPAVVTISLALGAQRMLRRRALIRKLPAVETLGSVTVIASDKTGTLTENKMAVQVLDVAGDTIDTSNGARADNPHQKLLLAASALANDSAFDGEKLIGDPTENAMLAVASRNGFAKDALEQRYPRVAEIPFSSERKRMTTIHRSEGRTMDVVDDEPQPYVAFTKGAPDGLLDICTHVFADGNIQPLDDQWLTRIESSNNKLAGEGLRVLGVAYRPLDGYLADDLESVEQHMVFIGLVGMIDPPRPEVIDAVKTSRGAGIRPVMITGDHPLTALAIAKQIGIVGENAEVMTGRELAVISDEELRQRVGSVSVYARVAPEHKLRIVQALRDNGNVVAMTGDGVNDAPALKRADIGVAMGITGTDVSKEASDMVITDDNFATIVDATEEGRAIFDNVRRFVKYLLASNTGELFVLLSAQLVAGMTIPLTTLQILWMNLITDGIPALALGVEKAEDDAMSRDPYAPNESILGRGLGRHILLIGATLGLSALALGVWAFQNDVRAANGAPAWNTMVFIMLTLAQMGHALGLRSHTKSLFNMNLFGNKILIGAVIATFVLQMMSIYLPFFNNIFGTNPLTLTQLVICMVLSTVVFWVVELEKLLMRRGVLK